MFQHAQTFPQNAMDYRKTISDLDSIKQVFKVASKLPHEENRIIFSFLICETPKIYGVSRNNFMRSTVGICVQARACCYYLARKHTSISLIDIAVKFKTHPTNVGKRIGVIADSVGIKRSHEELIDRITKIEKGLKTFLDENKMSHASL